MNDDLSTLSDIGVSKDLSKQAQDFAKLNEEAWRDEKRKWREWMPHGGDRKSSDHHDHLTRLRGLGTIRAP